MSGRCVLPGFVLVGAVELTPEAADVADLAHKWLQSRETGAPQPDMAFEISPEADGRHLVGGVDAKVEAHNDAQADDAGDDGKDAHAKDERDPDCFCRAHHVASHHPDW